ncbi:MAG: DUF1552 domain-containing protein [Alphaproteobacteria bacterium]|nr:DUF1552 domain-containing protein [Alphaproteobacteria bacterium]
MKRAPRRLHALHPERRLTRRHFLGGAGATLWLPWLEALSPPAYAQATRIPQRLLFWYVPNGFNMTDWHPEGEGEDYTLSPILSPLEAVREHVTVLSGLTNRAAIDSINGDHARGTGTFLTCAPINFSESDIYNGVSVDQIAAQALGADTALPSLQLGIEGGSGVGNCDSGYSCAYTRNISWASATTPLPQLTNPALLFDRLFGGSDATMTEEERARQERYRVSVIDSVYDQIEVLHPQLSVRDQRKLDEYLTGVRALEDRILNGATLSCEVPDRPPSELEYEAHVQMMLDLIVLAFECDATRFVSFMQGNGGSSRSHDFLGISDAYHDLSHHGGDPDTLALLTTIGTWEISQLATLIERLAAAEDAHGPLLDNCLVHFSSEIADGDSHYHVDLPVVLAGYGGGVVRPGRRLTLDDRPVADLFLTMLQAAGVDTDAFGQDGTSPIDLT